MNNSMMVYLNKRLHQADTNYQSAPTEPGPVICISREVGCGGVNLARMIAAELDKHTHCKKWKVLSKEILEESARELDMDPNKLKSFLKEGDRSLFDDIISAFSEKRYKSDRKISKTLIDLIYSFAIDGYCIIVGRAGHIISKDIDRSLLIQLTAPLDWRVSQIMRKNKMNLREAVDLIEKTEKERQNLRKHIAGDNMHDHDFDITLNIARMKPEEIVSLVKFVVQNRGFLETARSKVEVF